MYAVSSFAATDTSWYLTTCKIVLLLFCIWTSNVSLSAYKMFILKSYTVPVHLHDITNFLNQKAFSSKHVSFFYCENMTSRAHVAKFYGRLRSIRSVWRASKFSVFKIDWNCNFVGLLCLAKDHWWGFSARNTHMVHIVNLIRLKMVYTS